jgi:hypothetical protein
MTMLQFLTDWIQDAVLAGFIVSFFFPIVIALYWRWWQHEFGWNVVALEWSIAIALFPAFLHRVFGVSLTSVWYQWTIAVALTLIPVILIWRAWAIYKVQKDGSSRRERVPNGSTVRRRDDTTAT